MKTDVYSLVTNRIIELLEQGQVPWQSPYFSKVGFPKNFATGKAYRGINVFLLGCQSYTSPWFLTFLQAKELGGHIRKGERGSLVIKYGTYTKEIETEEVEGTTEPRRGFLKSYTVFNAAQIGGIEFPVPADLPELALSERTQLAREIVAGMPNPPVIKEGSAIPCYRPKTDSLHMPERGYFRSEEEFFKTLFHECVHATGSETRLARKSLLENKGIGATGSTARKIYAEEELVAEMGAAFLMAHAGIVDNGLENSAAYLQSWIAALKSKDAKGWIIRAAAQAQRAADFILNLQPAA